MTPQEQAELLVFLRGQADLIDNGATNDRILAQASSIVGGLTSEERDAAAMFYLIHLLKERHRRKVLGVERTSRKRVPFERTLAADDPYFAEKAARDEAYRAELMDIMRNYERSLRVQWTAELLASTFALPDGTLVAWGTATVEQHEQRRDMLVRNAQGNLEAAARHSQAISDCQAAGVSSLTELPIAA